MKRIFVLFFVVVFSCPAFVQAQETKYNKTDILHPIFSERVIISLVPVPLIFNGFRIDADIRLGDHLWLNIAPRLNLKIPEQDTGIRKFVRGGGLDINARYYMGNKPTGFYISAGLGMEYNQVGDFIKKSNEYIEVTSLRFGGQAYLGYSFRLWPRCVMDFYVGATFRYSSNSFADVKSLETYNNIRVNPFSYYFSGICFDGGIRIGITL